MNDVPVFTYYHPTTIVFIDDNELFLRGLDVELSDDHPFQLHHTPEGALEAVNVELETRPLADRCFSPPQGSPEELAATVHIDLSLIEQEIKLLDRFRRISVAVIDYSMPTIDGLEFCAAVSNPTVKKVLLTGVADEKQAVAAFNAGLIDSFVMKQDATAIDTVMEYVRAQENRYFSDLQHRLRSTLVGTLPRFIDEPAFVRYFHDLLRSGSFIEYYLVNAPLGFILLDEPGSVSRLLVADAKTLERQADYAASHHAPGEVVNKLASGAVIGFFYEPVETFFDTDGFPWNDYLYPAQPIGDSQWYTALVDDPPLDVDYHPEATSYRAFLAQRQRYPSEI